MKVVRRFCGKGPLKSRFLAASLGNPMSPLGRKQTVTSYPMSDRYWAKRTLRNAIPAKLQLDDSYTP